MTSGTISSVAETNKYLEEFLKAHEDIDFARGKAGIMREFLPKTDWQFYDQHGRFPMQFHEFANRNAFEISHNLIKKDTFRRSAVKKYAWSVPSNEAIMEVAKYSPIISIGAGSGYWEMLLQVAGAEVVAFDLLWDGTHKFEQLWFPVLYGDETKVLDYPYHTLFLSWPTYDDNFACRALHLTKAKNVVFVGEGCGGCTANDAFFELLEAQFEDIVTIDIPQYQHIRDRLTIFERKA